MTATLLVEELSTRLQAGVASWCEAETDMIALAGGEVDTSGCWQRGGARSSADWLAWRYKLSPARCREWVEAAQRLADRPVVSEALGSGQLTPAQALPLLQHLDAVDKAGDEKTVAQAASASVAGLAREARRATQVSREEALARHHQQSLTLTHNGTGGMWRINGTLADADGAAIATALRRKASQIPPDPNTGAHLPWDARMAHALREVCGLSLSVDKGTDLATLVIHVREDRAPEVHLGPTIADATFSRLMCDSRIQVLIEKADGTPIRLATTARTVPEWQRRAVEDRDQGCTFPTCGRSNTLLHCHHIVHRQHHGPGTHDNLTTLCYVHHRLVHEGGWNITRSQQGELTFHPPDYAAHGGAGPPPSNTPARSCRRPSTPADPPGGCPHDPGQ